MANDTDAPQTMSPGVSVIIPAYRTADHIAAALESVFAQTYTNFELIVVNDGSPDTPQLEDAIQPYLSRITYLKQDNGGPSSARNLGIRQARGEWLALLDSDDAWLPQYLAEQMKFLHGNAGLDMAYCDATLEGDPQFTGKTFMQLCPSAGPVTFESILTERTQVLTSATVVRRRNVIDVGLFDEELRCAEDHDLWLRISHAGAKIAYQQSPLLVRKLRPNSQGAAAEGLLAGELQSLTKLDRQLDLSPSTRALLLERQQKIQAELGLIEGKAFLLAGDPHKAYASLSRSNALAPTAKLRAVLFGLRIAPRLVVLGTRLFRRKAQPYSEVRNK